MSNLLSKASILLTPTATSDGTLHSVKPIQTFGSELVVNGDFADNSTWTTQSSVTFTNGTVIMDSASQNAYINQNILTVGRKYRVSITVEALSIVNKLDLINSSGITYERFGVGVNVFEITANQTAFRIRTKDGATSTISRASVQEITDGDFDFTRATTATRVNSSGLIESVASGLPRIDFLGGTGQILLEPASTNTATYSNDFTQGDIFSGSSNPSLTNTTLTANQGTAPDGTNTAFLLKDNDDGGASQTGLSYFSTLVDASDFNTFSVFVKKSLSNNFIFLSTGGYETAANGQSYFNIQDGTLGTVSSNHTAKIEDYGNGWFRCSITIQAATDLQGSFNVRLSTADNTADITRDGTNGVLLFGLQAEADTSRNFATSYIPTSGGTVTRNKDEANSSGDSSLINSTEGVLYAEVAALADDQTSRILTISDGTNNNRVRISYTTTSNQIQIRVKAGGSTEANISHTSSDITLFSKIAVKYKVNDVALFIGGVKIGEDTNATMPTGLNTLNFDKGDGGAEFFSKVKSVAVFKEALTDAQLISLTT